MDKCPGGRGECLSETIRKEVGVEWDLEIKVIGKVLGIRGTN